MLTETTIQKIDPAQQGIVTDILSQAITGELIGMSNFASLADVIDDYHEKMEAVEHADSERGHAEAFINVARRYGLDPIVNLQGQYWKNVRDCFMKYAKRQDFTACLIIQEVMLECFAVSMYKDVGAAMQNDIGELFTAISAEELEHIEHSIGLLQATMNADRNGFIEKFRAIHQDCMVILAEWTAKADLKGHCGVCKGNCMKESLPILSLDVSTIRGNAMNLYLKTLDRIGLPGDMTLQWVINLPA